MNRAALTMGISVVCMSSGMPSRYAHSLPHSSNSSCSIARSSSGVRSSLIFSSLAMPENSPAICSR